MTQVERVFKYISRRKTGATRSEIVRALRIPHPSACRRVEQLLVSGEIAVAPAQRNGAQVLVRS